MLFMGTSLLVLLKLSLWVEAKGNQSKTILTMIKNDKKLLLDKLQ